MPFKSKEDKAAWRRANLEGNREYNAAWLAAKLLTDPDYLKRKYAERKAKQPKSPKRCPCGREFWPKARQKYCAPACRPSKYVPAIPKAAQCVICTGDFLSINNCTTCSEECAKALHAAHNNRSAKKCRGLDPERERERDRKRYAKKPDYRQYKIDSSRERYEADPEKHRLMNVMRRLKKATAAELATLAGDAETLMEKMKCLPLLHKIPNSASTCSRRWAQTSFAASSPACSASPRVTSCTWRPSGRSWSRAVWTSLASAVA